MSISSLLNIGSRAMAASYAQLTVTGNNIANANTPGYSRQSADLETSFSQQTGAGFFGSGVDVKTVTRAHSDFLTREVSTSTAIAAADGARSTQLQQLENVFPTDQAGLGYAAQQAFNSFVDIANSPQDPSARQVTLSSLGDMANDFANASSQIDSQQAGVADELRTSVASVNSLTSQIAALNKQIAAAQSSGNTPNSLLDQRDTAMNNLSQLVQVTTVASADGTVGVYLGGSQTLVLGANATALTAVPDAFDPSKLQVG
ncbi:MAG: flagellar hook-associated protein FlgK, partial [Pseudomonadota bacterium]|nr:flagellar hook-associated protein FlgK [Pseudomonadota bacterium]